MGFYARFFEEHILYCNVEASALTSQMELDLLLAFMRIVGSTCRQPIYLTYEGDEGDPQRNAFLIYEPNDDDFRTAQPSLLSGGPVLGEPTRLILFEDGATLRLLLSQDAEWEDSPSQLEEIEARLRSVMTYALSEQLDWERGHSPTRRWPIEVRCVTQPPPLTVKTFDQARDSIQAQGGDLMIKPPDASAGLFD